MASQYCTLDTMATPIPITTFMGAHEIVYIFNDDDTNKLYINFNGEDPTGWITILPQEKMFNFPSGIDMGYITYKSSLSDVAFRVLGNRNA